jgi:hypothetical protein
MNMIPGLIAVLTVSAPLGSSNIDSSIWSSTAMTVIEEKWAERDRHPAPVNLAENTEQFIVIYTIDYGYRFRRESDPDKLIVPEFSDKSILNELDHIFSPDNMANYYGKKIYCDCAGELVEREGATFYNVKGGRLYAK